MIQSREEKGAEERWKWPGIQEAAAWRPGMAHFLAPKHRKGSKRLKQQERLQLDFWRHILLGRTVKH